MEGKLRSTLFLINFMFMVVFSSAQTCSKYAFSGNQMFSACNDLPFLNSYLHWSYNASSSKLQIAYRHTAILNSNRWVAWAINPTSRGMVGSQALVAYHKSDGTIKVYTAPIRSYQTSLQEGKLSFDVSDLSATYANNEMIIFATLDISKIGKTSNINQVWQEGPVSTDSPQIHSTSGPNVQSMGTVNLLSGTVGASGGNDKIKRRKLHGVLNTISWGIMMPLGALIARYLRVFKSADPACFYLHATCQSIAYIVGVVGWGTGLKLGSQSSGIQYDAHRTIGIILFCLGTLQAVALLLRPKPDHKYRFYWNIYHHIVGYTVIILSIINIFKGLGILNPERKWKNGYIGVIAALVLNAIWLEGYTWHIVAKRKSIRNENISKGINGVDGYGAAQHQGVYVP